MIVTSIAFDAMEIAERAHDDLEQLRNGRVFITGGTGFVGTWLVSALRQADLLLALNLDVTVLTRNPIHYQEREPALADWVTLMQGDIAEVPRLGTFDAAIHTATPASAALIDDEPELMRTTIVAGMRSVIAALESSGPIPFLFTSSGAIYGPQPSDLTKIPESFIPDESHTSSSNVYTLGKREAEAIAQDATTGSGPSLRLARLFAFVGPYLPLDQHFAVGNFIADALAGREIRVAGDGTPIRSYMYATDMVVALLAVLVRGTPSRPYNVGSSSEVTITELASLVGQVVSPGIRVTVQHQTTSEMPTSAGNRYVPDTTRIVSELGFESSVTLADGIARTAAWHRSK
jgi:nucleoside-diphosphate-sugar epimerase